jgi:hypothetical protein
MLNGGTEEWSQNGTRERVTNLPDHGLMHDGSREQTLPCRDYSSGG